MLVKRLHVAQAHDPFHPAGRERDAPQPATPPTMINADVSALAAEKTIHARTFEPGRLAAEFSEAIRRTHAQLAATKESELLTVRLVGRAQLPSNTIGLLVHAAEHTARHVGQLMTTAKVVRI